MRPELTALRMAPFAGKHRVSNFEANHEGPAFIAGAFCFSLPRMPGLERIDLLQNSTNGVYGRPPVRLVVAPRKSFPKIVAGIALVRRPDRGGEVAYPFEARLYNRD